MFSGNANSYKGESLVSPFISDRTSVSKIASSSESSESWSLRGGVTLAHSVIENYHYVWRVGDENKNPHRLAVVRVVQISSDFRGAVECLKVSINTWKVTRLNMLLRTSQVRCTDYVFTDIWSVTSRHAHSHAQQPPISTACYQKACSGLWSFAMFAFYLASLSSCNGTFKNVSCIFLPHHDVRPSQVPLIISTSPPNSLPLPMRASLSPATTISNPAVMESPRKYVSRPNK